MLRSAASTRRWRRASGLAESALAPAVARAYSITRSAPGWPAGTVRLNLVWGGGALPTAITFSWRT